jgi:hypothetical protein
MLTARPFPRVECRSVPTALSEDLSDLQDGRIGRLWADRKAKLTAHLQHRLVLTQHLPDEFAYAVLPCDADETSHQEEANTVSFPIAANGDRLFRAHPVGIGKEMRYAERHTVALGNKAQFPVVIQLRQPGRNGVCETRYGREESKPQVFAAHVRCKIDEQRLVLRTQRLHAEHCAVAQPLDGFELLRVWRNRQARWPGAFCWRDPEPRIESDNADAVCEQRVDVELANLRMIDGELSDTY